MLMDMQSIRQILSHEQSETLWESILGLLLLGMPVHVRIAAGGLVAQDDLRWVKVQSERSAVLLCACGSLTAARWLVRHRSMALHVCYPRVRYPKCAPFLVAAEQGRQP